jgi:2'-5' RNA ligase
MMRCFVAIDIDEDIRRQIGQLQKKLQKNLSVGESEIKWVDPELIHLTLKFIGDVPDRDINELCAIVSDVAAAHNVFSVDVNGLGYFGSPPRVAWVGIESPPELIDLQKELDERLSMTGLAPEDNKAFHGHLTLCRSKNYKAGRKLQHLLDDYGPVELGIQTVDTVCVYTSELTKQGPVYTVVSSNKLK